LAQSALSGAGCQAGATVASRGREHDVRGRTDWVSTSRSEIEMHSGEFDVSNAIVFPSGLQARQYGAYANSLCTRSCRSPVPSRFSTRMLDAPSNWEVDVDRTKATRDPSGDQAGASS
jgi:hypothetical protein